MRKVFVSILFVIFSLSVVFSLEIGISPQEIKIKTQEENRGCKEFEIMGGNFSFSGEALWSRVESRKIGDYNLDGEHFGLEEVYPEVAFPGKHTFCVSSKKQGSYYGVLKYKLDGSNYGLVSWVSLEVEGQNLRERLVFLQSGTIKNLKEETTSQISAVLSTILICLSIIFVLLVVTKNK